jgi:hypothetical protein
MMQEGIEYKLSLFFRGTITTNDMIPQFRNENDRFVLVTSICWCRKHF